MWTRGESPIPNLSLTGFQRKCSKVKTKTNTYGNKANIAIVIEAFNPF